MDMNPDVRYDEAAGVVIEAKRGSCSLLQRRLGIGYARAYRLIEQLKAGGILGEFNDYCYPLKDKVENNKIG